MHDAYESLEQLIARGYCVSSAAAKISADGSDYKRLVEYGKEFLGDPEAEHYEARPPTGRTSIIYKGEIYDSATDVAREFGVARSTVYRWVKDGMAVIVKNESEVKSTITSKRIKELRKRTGMSQLELSTAIGASKNGVWLWERGTKPNRKSIAMICKYFNVAEDWLLGKEVEDDIHRRIRGLHRGLEDPASAHGRAGRRRLPPDELHLGGHT